MSDTDIVSIHGRRIWDSRGRPTVEVEVKLQAERAVVGLLHPVHRVDRRRRWSLEMAAISLVETMLNRLPPM